VDLRQLERFLAVAEEPHVGRAGKRFHLAQPTVSQSVRRLEHELGGALFELTTRAVSLTPARLRLRPRGPLGVHPCRRLLQSSGRRKVLHRAGDQGVH